MKFVCLYFISIAVSWYNCKYLFIFTCVVKLLRNIAQVGKIFDCKWMKYSLQKKQFTYVFLLYGCRWWYVVSSKWQLKRNSRVLSLNHYDIEIRNLNQPWHGSDNQIVTGVHVTVQLSVKLVLTGWTLSHPTYNQQTLTSTERPFWNSRGFIGDHFKLFPCKNLNLALT
jgi:hypothetical protein